MQTGMRGSRRECARSFGWLQCLFIAADVVCSCTVAQQRRDFAVYILVRTFVWITLVIALKCAFAQRNSFSTTKKVDVMLQRARFSAFSEEEKKETGKNPGL